MEDHKELTRRESRKEMRKESRLLKRKNRFLSWVQHKNNGKMKTSDLEETPCKELHKEDPDLSDDPVAKIGPVKNRKRKASVKPSKKTKFQEYLDLEITKDKDDLEMERKLAKKLKVRGGKLGGVDDGLNDFLGIISMQEDADEIASGEKERNNAKHTSSLRKKRGKKRCTPGKETQPVERGDDPGNEEKELAVEAAEQLNVSEKNLPQEEINAKCAKYVAPHLQTCSRAESEELVQFRRRVRGLLNRLSESNVEPITEEIAAIFRTIARSDGCRIIGEAVMSSCVNGPRGSEQHTSVFAAFVAGMACLVGIDFSAKLIASLAVAYENEYVKEDNLSLRNITLLLSYLCIFGVCSSDLIYDFLSVLSKRMTESDTSTILAVLQCCGMKLRSDDPTAMKNFILNIQNRVSELKCPTGTDAQPKINNKRMEFMLETICDIKNNKRREKEDPAHHTRIKKWLQKLKAEDILLRGLKWSKLLDPEKKGQWWLFGEITCTDDTVEDVAVRIDKEVLEAQKLIQLASEHRMNTDLRRAIFCVIMSGEDYLDAFEKILRLDLSGKQDREIMRVLVKCCLQEKMFNKYYIFLASKLCSHDKNHKFTLQYCLWDHYKTLDSMPPHSSVNLAKFVAEMLSSFTLSLALLKSVDLTNPEQLTPNRIQHFQMLFEAIFEKTDAVIWNMFTHVAALPEREVLGQSLEFFIKRFVITHDPEKSFAAKFRIAKKALNNVAGVLM